MPSIWAANRDTREIVRIDPRTNKVVANISFPPGVEPRSVDVVGDSVWATVGTPGYFG